MATHDYTIKSEGGKRYLITDYRGSPFGPSVADFPQCMRQQIEYLAKTDADLIVLADVYERVYNEEQTRMLKQIGELVNLFRKEGVWNYSHLVKGPDCERFLQQRHDTVASIATDMMLSDPIKAYLTLMTTIKREEEALKSQAPQDAECTKHYLRTLTFMAAGFEKTLLIQRFRAILQKLRELPPGRQIYHTIFEAEIKPAFVSSRVFFATPKNIELIDQYVVQGSTVSIYKHPDKIQYLYYTNPPEYDLSPEQYFLLSKTREMVANFHPKGLQFMEPREIKKYFTKTYETTIVDLAQKSKIPLARKEVDKLAGIVARYTVGYGMMELLLSDRRLTDVYMDSPLGAKPVYVIHTDYGSCQTNVMFTEEEAKGIVSRLRAQSGRPFDEAHPVLDLNMADLQTRVCVIGPPLAPDGIAFALRLHKVTPWTLPQFIDVKMLDAQSAGLLSFLVDAQASTLVTGSRGSGKTSMLMALMLEVLPSLRFIVQEDTLEIPVPTMKKLGFNVQRLKTRSAIAVSRTEAEVAPEEALRTALRLGDSVLIVGEVRSKEAIVLYEAMRIGAVGNVVMGTIHAESAYSVWDRIVNDLGVPNTSFKATDSVVVCAPVRFRGSIKRTKRLVGITEVGKHWYEDPEKEGGLIDILGFDTAKDTHFLYEDNLKKSELFPKLSKSRGLKIEELWANINAISSTKQFLVDMKNKYKIPDLLEARFTVPANDNWHLILEKQRQLQSGLNFTTACKEWEKWVSENQVKPLLARRREVEKRTKKR